MMRVDLNCDMGESFGSWVMGQDEAMLDIVTSANVACGFHAGDPQIMLQTACMAKARGVALGAHPGFPDIQGFGRRRMLDISPQELTAMVTYQIGAMQAIATLAGHRVTHVKAHGALSNMACDNLEMASAIAKAIRAVDGSLVFVVLPQTMLEQAGEAAGLSLAREVFADRAYDDDYRLVSRAKPGSVLHDPALVAARVLDMVKNQAITAASGKKLPVSVDTICIHGDTPGALSMAQAVHKLLVNNGVSVKAFVEK